MAVNSCLSIPPFGFGIPNENEGENYTRYPTAFIANIETESREAAFQHFSEMGDVTDWKDEVADRFKMLSDDEKERLAKQDSRLVSTFVSKKLEDDVRKNWDLFYKRNQTKFFKDRHWMTKEFKELLGIEEGHCKMGDRRVFLEIGCGVGNLVYPLIEESMPFKFYACDLSPKAVEFFKAHPSYDEKDVIAFEADITKLGSITQTPPVDIATLVFVLSSIHPVKFNDSIKNIYNILKPGGILLFRDYGLFDMAQIRFKPGHKISENFYMRQDGTRSYFFSREVVEELFKKCGFHILSNSYVHRRTVNKKEDIDVLRTFIQAKLMKPY